MADKLKTIVKRSEWLRGTGSGVLLDAAGMKCCLGFRELQRGVSPEAILDVPMPEEYERLVYIEQTEHWMDAAGRVNDSYAPEIGDREAELIRIFREAGEEIEFVD